MEHFKDNTIYHILQFDKALEELEQSSWLTDQLVLKFKSDVLYVMSIISSNNRELYIESRYTAIEAAKLNSIVYKHLPCYIDYRNYLDEIQGEMTHILEQFELLPVS